MEADQRRLRETAATARKFERVWKETVQQADDDRRQVAELTSLTDQLTMKCKTYKRMIEEAVSISFTLSPWHFIPQSSLNRKSYGLVLLLT